MYYFTVISLSFPSHVTETGIYNYQILQDNKSDFILKTYNHTKTELYSIFSLYIH